MGHELVSDKTGKELHINIADRMLLDRLTAGWWDLIGYPEKITEVDCKMLARVLENYANLQMKMDDNTRKIMRWDAENQEGIDWILNEAVPFFRDCGGCHMDG